MAWDNEIEIPHDDILHVNSPYKDIPRFDSPQCDTPHVNDPNVNSFHGDSPFGFDQCLPSYRAYETN